MDERRARWPLWTCPKCEQSFVTANMSHSCTQLTEEEFFGSREAQRALYHHFLDFVRGFGPVRVNINKTRISFQGRVSFAGVAPVTTDGIFCGFWLKRRIESPRFTRVEHIPPGNYVYQFRLTDPAELDEEVAGWIAEAWRVGMQAWVSPARSP